MNAQTIDSYAVEMVRLSQTASLAEPLTAREEGFSLADAYLVSAAALNRREATGWRRRGRKIGFTNRTILEQYGVYEPIFGYMYDETVIFAATGTATLPLKDLVQPLIEPEIAFSLRRSPPPEADPLELLGCIEWLAHGFEIVQCHFPDWKFKAPDTVADGGLHGRYVVGEIVPVEEPIAVDLFDQLAAFRIASFKNGQPAAEGGGELVLGSPLHALARLVHVLKELPDHPPLEAGELITTGTLTTALPVAPGEVWTTQITGLPVPGLELRFE